MTIIGLTASLARYLVNTSLVYDTGTNGQGWCAWCNLVEVCSNVKFCDSFMVAILSGSKF